jgi:hypothetical protein
MSLGSGRMKVLLIKSALVSIELIKAQGLISVTGNSAADRAASNCFSTPSVDSIMIRATLRPRNLATSSLVTEPV